MQSATGRRGSHSTAAGRPLPLEGDAENVRLDRCESGRSQSAVSALDEPKGPRKMISCLANYPQVRICRWTPQTIPCHSHPCQSDGARGSRRGGSDCDVLVECKKLR